MPPRLTIITPTLNQAAFIERTITSVLDQGYEDLEYFVVDGGSTDGTVEIIERYADRVAWWVSEPDQGQTDALNKALARATGDVVAYINSDDYYLPGAFAAAMGAFERAAGARWVAGTCRYLHPDGTIDTDWVPGAPRGPRGRLIHERWYAPQASSFWRRDVFEQYGRLREDLHFVFDTEFGLRLALAGVRPLVVDALLAVRFLHDEAKSADASRFRDEYDRVAHELAAGLSARDRAAYRAWRAVTAPRRALFGVRERLGLLHLRERLRPPSA